VTSLRLFIFEECEKTQKFEREKIFFVGILKVKDEKYEDTDPDPDPYQNATDPEPC
jgi:hypothetical protein